MSLSQQINADIKAAMLAKEKEKLEALRAVKAAFLVAQTEKGGSNELSEDTELKIIQKLVKQRKDSAEMYKANNRIDLYDKEIAQAKVIEQYLPEQLGEEEIQIIVEDIISSVEAKGMQDMGKVMGVATKKLSGKADGKVISQIVKKLLANL